MFAERPNQSPQLTADRRENLHMTTSTLEFAAQLASVRGWTSGPLSSPSFLAVWLPPPAHIFSRSAERESWSKGCVSGSSWTLAWRFASAPSQCSPDSRWIRAACHGLLRPFEARFLHSSESQVHTALRSREHGTAKWWRLPLQDTEVNWLYLMA